MTKLPSVSPMPLPPHMLIVNGLDHILQPLAHLPVGMERGNLPET